jgi:hypothetical protein
MHGKRHLDRAIYCVPDLRLVSVEKGSAQTAACNAFFQHIYTQTAEMLPNKSEPRITVQQMKPVSSDCWNWGTWLNYSR